MIGIYFYQTNNTEEVIEEQIPECHTICMERGFQQGAAGINGTVPDLYQPGNRLVGALDTEGNQCYCKN